MSKIIPSIPERFRYLVIGLILIAIATVGWLLQQSGDSPTDLGRRAAQRVEPRRASESFADVSSRSGVRDAKDQSAVVSELVAAISDGGDLSSRLTVMNELAALPYRAVDQALAGIANDSSLPVRVRRQALLLHAGKPSALSRETMVAMLQSKEEDLRLAAAQGLGIRGQSDGFSALNEAFLVEPSAGVAKAVLQSMARIGSPESVEALILHSSPDNLPNDMSRDAVLGSLAGITNPEAVPALTTALTTSPDAESRRAIVSSLARVADASSFELFLDIAQNDPDPETAYQAMQGLGMIGNPLALETLRTIETTSDDVREQSFARTAIQRIEGIQQ